MEIFVDIFIINLEGGGYKFIYEFLDVIELLWRVKCLFSGNNYSRIFEKEI